MLVSRGELVEIGGSFRIPEILRKAAARLREVGTTNRTRIADYEHAIGPDTALILKVHPSNFRIVGFTGAAGAARPGDPGARPRRAAGRGPGQRRALAAAARPIAEPTVAASLEAGVDLVTFSGDKLVGGPQAGLAAGRKSVADAMRRNPLYRALRVDKMTLAALDAVLAAHEAGRAARRGARAEDALPVRRGRARARGAAGRGPGRRRAGPGGGGRGGQLRGGRRRRARAPRCRPRSWPWPTRRGPPRAWPRGCARGTPPVVARVAEDRWCWTCAPCARRGGVLAAALLRALQG